MKTRTLIATAALTLGLSASANAAPAGIDKFLSHVVSAAIEATTTEIQNEISESILNSAHHVSVSDITTRVEITDTTTDEEE